MTKQQLLDLLKRKGQDEKRAQLNHTYSLTKDSEDLEDMPDRLRQKISNKNRKIE